MHEVGKFEQDKYYLDYLNRPITSSTKYRISKAFDLYMRFYAEVMGENVTPKGLLLRAKSDREKDSFEAGDIERQWVSFVQWLSETYTKHGPHGEDLVKPLAPTSIRSYSGIIKSFFAHYGVPMSKRATLPKKIARSKGKVENVAIRYRPEQVRRLISVMSNNEHKALALIQFQGGLDVSTAYSLKWKDVKRQMERGDSPMLLTLERGKTGTIFKTCLGSDAIETIRNHMAEMLMTRFRCLECGASWKDQRKKCPYCKKQSVREYRDELKPNDFLFSRGREIRHRVQRDYQSSMRRYVVSAGIQTPEELADSDMSRGRPHALRAGFSSILKSKGVDRELVEFMLGHEIPYGGAYFKMSDDEIIDVYRGAEKYLSLNYREEYDILESRVNEELGQMRTMNDALLNQNQDLKSRIEELEKSGALAELLRSNPKIKELL